MPLVFHQVDAFSSQPFAGNPAMVYRLEQWLDEALLQRIAAEHNLAETAFVVREGAAWRIRWFTPSAEVPLCGHATLASARVLFDCYGEPGERLAFLSLSGPLSVSRQGAQLVLDFPQLPVQRRAMPAELSAVLDRDCSGLELFEADRNLLLILPDEASVRALQPDLRQLGRLPWQGLIVSARGERHDFVSRYFAPAIGIDEDPVTGFAHCILTPFWAQRLGRNPLTAFQCSARGGELHCQWVGERVRIAGQACLVARGELLID